MNYSKLTVSIEIDISPFDKNVFEFRRVMSYK